MQSCEEEVRNNTPKDEDTLSVYVILAKRIDEQAEHINNLEERITKYEDEIDLLWPAWRESNTRIETLEKLAGVK